jgi:hypothetical protein
MFSRVFSVFFGCLHNRYSFPITIKKGTRSRAASITGTYVVCLDCGKEMPYDWKEMRIVNPAPKAVPVTPLATKEAA